MCCDYYIEKSLVIDYISVKGQICKISLNIKKKKCYLNTKKYKYNSVKYNEKLYKKIAKKSYTKMIYEKNTWIKEKYQTKYEKKLKTTFPEIKEFIKIFKDNVAHSYYK
jgi:hypothetical protein